MALISKASLLMVPSTYEEGTLYNVLPSGNRAPDSTDQNSGYDQTRADFSFDRGSNAAATRVNSDGLIEKYRENLLLQSNQFDTTWTKQNVSVTSGQSGYDGSSNAWKLIAAGGNNDKILQSVTQTGVVTLSVYAKAGNVNFIAFEYSGYAYFNLSTGAVGISGGIIDSNIEDVGGEWYRCSITVNISSTTNAQIYVTEANNSTNTSNGDFVYIQNAQLESGMVSTDVLTSGATTAKAGVLIDLPRINFDANGENGSLLLEPQRANLVQFSEYFGASYWTKNNQSVTVNNTTSPDGYSNADLLIPAAGTGDHYILSGTVSATSSQVVTCSIFVKKKDHDYFYFGTGGASAFGAVVYQFSTNTFTVSGLSATATNYGNGWIRLTITGTTGATDLRLLFTPTDATGLRTFNANGTDGTWIWGAQAELGSYVSSYIPNHGTSSGVTRAADVCNGGGSAESINSTEGVLYAEISALADDGTYRIFSINDGTTNERVYIQYTNASNAIAVVVKNGNTTQANISHTLTDETQNAKVAFKYKANDFALYINGSQIGTDTSGSTPVGLNNFSFDQGNGANFFYGNVKQVAVFNEALSNSELATLTTL